MNKDLMKLLEVLKRWNGGEISKLIEDELTVFATDYEIETIKELVEAMETEESYFEN